MHRRSKHRADRDPEVLFPANLVMLIHVPPASIQISSENGTPVEVHTVTVAHSILNAPDAAGKHGSEQGRKSVAIMRLAKRSRQSCYKRNEISA